MDMKILVGCWPGRVPVNGERDKWDGNTGGRSARRRCSPWRLDNVLFCGGLAVTAREVHPRESLCSHVPKTSLLLACAYGLLHPLRRLLLLRVSGADLALALSAAPRRPRTTAPR
jgi:hypothetical protein